MLPELTKSVLYFKVQLELLNNCKEKLNYYHAM
jgi:hypothetical protein